MVLVKCLYCDADNDPRSTGGYCDSCGKKLPPASAYRSHRSGGEGLAGTDLPIAQAERNRTSEALFTAAVLELIGGGLFLVLGPMLLTLTARDPNQPVPEAFLPLVLTSTALGLVLYGLLALLARFQARAAAILALGLFGLRFLVPFVFVPIAAAWQIPVNVAILVFLIRAFQASAPGNLIRTKGKTMGVRITIPPQLRQQADGQNEVEVNGSNVQEALAALGAKFPALTPRIMEGGSVRRFVNVYLNSEDIRYLENLATPVKDGDELAIMPAVTGG